MGWTISDDTLRSGFAHARWSGRLQTVHWRDQPLLLDGAHNPPAARQLSQERQRWPGQEGGLNWIFGIQAHKQGMAMLETLLQPQDRAWIVPVPGHSSWTRSSLLEQKPQWNDQLLEANDAEQALLQIHAPEQRPNRMTVLAGSLYLIGDLLARGLVTAE